MAHLELSFLGTCSLTLDGKPIHGFASDKVRLLLAYLAVESDRPHSRQQLVEIFWPAHPAQAANASLRSALSNLRSILKSDPSGNTILDTDRENIQLSLSPGCFLDVAAFEGNIAEAESLLTHSDDLPSAMSHFQAAADLYRGGFLEGFTLKDCPEFDDWCYFVGERLLHKATTALSHLSSYHESRCEYPTAIRFARRHVELEPWQEAAHADLIRLLALSGKQSAALEQFQICRQMLRDELDIEPSPETIQLYESIRSGKFAQVQPANPRFSQLPTYLTPLVGRAKELDEIAHLLHDPACRLLTLLGPGGCGKTRLAVETAARQTTHYQDGACFVPLVATERVEAIIPSILHALGVTTPYADLNQALFGFLHHKQLLLVLDNFEQLLLEGSELLPELLSQAPYVKLLVTSRQRLHLDSENVFHVEGLSLPSPQQTAEARSFDAIQLFSQTVQRQRGDPISDGELTEVVRICRSVGGMPLAIKIAASWARVLTCAEIAAEIERSLSFLATDDRELQSRHRSIQAVFESTWQRLSPEEQAAFRKLSVFRGGFTRPAFEAVTGASLQILTLLVDQCLVTHRPNRRYELHELLRQFAEEKLRQDFNDEERTRTAHSHFYLGQIQSMDFIGPHMSDHIARMQSDQDNLHTAWFRTVAQGDYAMLDAVCDPLVDYSGKTLRYIEGVTWFEESLSNLPGTPPAHILTKFLTIKARFLITVGKEIDGLQILAESLELADRNDLQELKPRIYKTIAYSQFTDDFQEGIRNYEKSIPIDQRYGNKRSIASSYWWMGVLWFTKGYVTKSAACLKESLKLCRESQHQDFEMHSVRMLALVNLVKEDLSIASALYQELQVLVTKIGIPGVDVYPLFGLGLVNWKKGSIDEANQLFEQGLQDLQECVDHRKLGWLPVKPSFHILFCQVLEDEEKYEEMYYQAQQALELYRQAGFYHEWGDPWVEPLEWLARAEMHLGDYPSARQHLVQFIHDCLVKRYTDWALFGLYFYAELLVKEEDSPKRKCLALELLTFVRHHPRLEGIDYHPAIFGKPALPTLEAYAAQLAAGLPPAQANAARERGSRLVLDEVVQDLVAGKGRYWEVHR